MRFCEAHKCNAPVFGTCKKSGKGYCRSHQTLREDFDRRSIIQKAVAKQKRLVNKVRGLHEVQDKVQGGDLMELWFRSIRQKLVGTCQCGCGNKSQKDDDMYFRHSCCHIFPKGKFESIKYHPLNYVERAFWGGCHGVLDDTSMDRWVNMADWDDIKAKFLILAPLLTDKEKAIKFYTHLERLVYGICG